MENTVSFQEVLELSKELGLPFKAEVEGHLLIYDIGGARWAVGIGEPFYRSSFNRFVLRVGAMHSKVVESSFV